MTSTTYGITAFIMENTHTNEIWWWLLSLIGNNSLFIYTLTVQVHQLTHIGTKWHDFQLFLLTLTGSQPGQKNCQMYWLSCQYNATWHSTWANPSANPLTSQRELTEYKWFKWSFEWCLAVGKLLNQISQAQHYKPQLNLDYILHITYWYHYWPHVWPPVWVMNKIKSSFSYFNW